MVQLLTPYTAPERHNAQHHRLTDKHTGRVADDSMMPVADHTVWQTDNRPTVTHKADFTQETRILWPLPFDLKIALIGIALFQDSGHNAISRKKVMPPGEWTRSVCPVPMQCTQVPDL